MKVERGFIPLVITLESKNEIKELLDAISRMEPTHFISELYEMLVDRTQEEEALPKLKLHLERI